MKTNLFNALVAMVIFATLSSCSKEEQAEVKPVTVSQNPLDPDGDGLIFLPEGEVYFIEDSVLIFGQVSTKYKLFKPLSLEKYKNGELLDSICNQDIAARFDIKGRKSHDKSLYWGDSPWVFEDHPPVITFRVDNTLTIKLSKMVTAFGYEINSPYTGVRRAIETTFRNSKLNKTIPPVLASYTSDVPTNRPYFGMPGGALLYAKESATPFDEIVIKTVGNSTSTPPLPGPFDVTLANFRYKLGK
jgi:hypothetical protein